MYIMLGRRPDLSFSISYFSSFQNSYGEHHWMYLKKMLRYLKGTRKYSLLLNNSNEQPLTGYVDSDFANDERDSKSITGYVFKVFGNTVVWKTQQSVVALSSAEAEFIALATLGYGMFISQ